MEAVNARIELVARVRGYKESRGIEFVDHAQERRIVQELTRLNRGPLSPEGLRTLYTTVFELTKDEVSRRSSGP